MFATIADDYRCPTKIGSLLYAKFGKNHLHTIIIIIIIVTSQHKMKGKQECEHDKRDDTQC